MKMISQKLSPMIGTPKHINIQHYLTFLPGILATPMGNDGINQPDYTPKSNPNYLRGLEIFLNTINFGRQHVYANTFAIDMMRREKSIQLLKKNALEKLRDLRFIAEMSQNPDEFINICAEQGLFNPFTKYNPIDAVLIERAFLMNNSLFSIMPYNFMAPIEQVALKKAVEILMDLQRCPNINSLTLCGHSNGGILIYHIAMYIEMFIETGILDFMTTIETDADGRQKIGPQGPLKKLSFVDPALQETLKKIIDAGQFNLVSIMSPFKGSEKANLADFLTSMPLGQMVLRGTNLIRSLSGNASEESLQVPRHLLNEQPLTDKIMDTAGTLIFPNPTSEGMSYSTSRIVQRISEITKANKICLYSDKHMTVNSYALVSQEGGDAPPFYLMPIGEEKGDGTVVATSQILDGIMPMNCISINENIRHNELMQNLSIVLKSLPNLDQEFKNYNDIKKSLLDLEK